MASLRAVERLWPWGLGGGVSRSALDVISSCTISEGGATAIVSGNDSGMVCSIVLEISCGRALGLGGRDLRGREVEAGRAALGCSGCSVGWVVSLLGIMFLRLSLPVILEMQTNNSGSENAI
jgi:hypothetical protein